MQEITQSLPQAATLADIETRNFAERLRRSISRMLARRHTRLEVEGLSDAQLRDVGIDRAMVLGNRPVIAVNARLATYLISLR